MRLGESLRDEARPSGRLLAPYGGPACPLPGHRARSEARIRAARRILAATFAGSALFVALQFVWISPSARLPVGEGYRHVAEPSPFSRFTYAVRGGVMAGREAAWLGRWSWSGGGCGNGASDSAFILARRVDGIYADFSALGGPVPGFESSPEVGRAISEARRRGRVEADLRLLVPSGLRSNMIWRVGSRRVECLGRETIFTRYGLCRAWRLRVARIAADDDGRDTADLFYVPGLGVPRIRFRISLDDHEETYAHAEAAVAVSVPWRRARLTAGSICALLSLALCLALGRRRKISRVIRG